jgi:hypothetical protein
MRVVPSLVTAVISTGRYRVICAALAKRYTAVGNEWLGKRLTMEHSAHVSNLVNRMRKSAKNLKILRKYETLLWKSKDPHHGGDAFATRPANKMRMRNRTTTHSPRILTDGTVGSVVFDTAPDADPAFIQVRAEIPSGAASPDGKLFGRLYSTGNRALYSLQSHVTPPSL